jgi:uncharacterized membrane protein YjjP (DUF1212 family)
MTSHKISLNGKILCNVGSAEQYRVVTMVASYNRFDAEGLQKSESSVMSHAFDASGNVESQREELVLKKGDVIQIEIL